MERLGRRRCRRRPHVSACAPTASSTRGASNTYGQLGLGRRSACDRCTDQGRRLERLGGRRRRPATTAWPCAPTASSTPGATNSYGQLGLGDPDAAERAQPTKVGTWSDWVAVAAGEIPHPRRCAPTASSTPGAINWDGQLGCGGSGRSASSRPRSAPGATGRPWRRASTHSLALRANGELYAWGDNDYGQLGFGDTTIAHPAFEGRRLERLGGGGRGADAHLGRARQRPALRLGRQLASGQLGLGDTTDRCACPPGGRPGATGRRSLGPVPGTASPCAPTARCTSGASTGTVGSASAIHRPPRRPRRSACPTTGRNVSAGGYHTAAVKEDGSLWAFGDNSEGQLGLGDRTRRVTPTRWGDRQRLGDGLRRHLPHPRPAQDGSLWAWGDNAWGQLGLGHTTDRDWPNRVGVAQRLGGDRRRRLLQPRPRRRRLALGLGRQRDGQLGVGDTTLRTEPTPVGAASDWAAIACGGGHVLALKRRRPPLRLGRLLLRPARPRRRSATS